MKFIVDAQLPFELAIRLKQMGYDVIHTNDLPKKEYTTDNEIRKISVNENRIVITKDSDFLDSYYINGVPSKLLLISTGNIKNKDLLKLVNDNIEKINGLFSEYSLLELDNLEIKGHE